MARTPTPWLRRMVRGGAAAAGMCLLTIVVLEGVTRLWGYSDRYLCDPIYQPFAGSEEIPYVLKPGLRDARAPTATVFSTDRRGLRVARPHLEAGPASLRIAVVGDSVSFGQGVETEETFCEVLQERLRNSLQRDTIQVLNFGVPGYSVREMAASVHLRVAETEPLMAIMCLIFSDFELERCGVVDRWGYLHNRKLASYDHPDALRYLVLRRLHLAFLVRDLRARYRAGRGRGNDGGAWPEAMAGGIPAAFPFVGDFAHAAYAHGIEPLIVTLPTIQHDGSEFRAVSHRLAADGIPHLDLAWLRREFSDEAFGVSHSDGHPSAAVHRRIGEELADALPPIVQVR